MFPEAIHEPALALAETLLQGLQNPRLKRVFFSDNGSTGNEVALKMALRATRLRYGWPMSTKLGVLGLKGSYHGDTIGAMDCVEPGEFNNKVEWYEGKGFWLDYPTVKCIDGRWLVQFPNELRDQFGLDKDFASLADIFNLPARASKNEQAVYEAYITDVLRGLQGRLERFGALILEPVVLGAGGMMLV
jgi:dethiobiotin synthetase/adenosylmethionine--8-amino-7-oxononanoate aminotransferase